MLQFHRLLWNDIRRQFSARLQTAKRRDRSSIEADLASVEAYLAAIKREWASLVILLARMRGKLEAFEGILLVRETGEATADSAAD